MAAAKISKEGPQAACRPCGPMAVTANNGHQLKELPGKGVLRVEPGNARRRP